MLVGSFAICLLGSAGFALAAAFVSGDSLFSSVFFVLMAGSGLVGAGEVARRLLRQRALVFDLRRGQRDLAFEVEVSLAPRSPVRLTAVIATLECVQVESNEVEPMAPQFSTLFVVSERLLERSLQLGHGEQFTRSAALALPASARPTSRSGSEPEIRYELKVRVEVDGTLFFEHSEQVPIALPG